MHETTETTRRRLRRIISSALCIAAVMVAAGRYWQHRHLAATHMTLREALWVTEPDYSRYFAPGSRESRRIVAALVRQNASLSERRFDLFVLYRLGLSDTSSAGEALLIAGFDPSSVPRARVVPAR